jgi:hypothetical protein
VQVVGRERMDPETQEFLQAMDGYMLALTNEMMGVRGASAEEAREFVWRTFGFEQGDQMGNILNTMDELRTKVIGMELSAGAYLNVVRNMAEAERAETRAEVDRRLGRENQNRFSRFGRP